MRTQTGKLVALFVVLSLCHSVWAADAKADDDQSSPVFSEMKSKLFKNLASMIMNGGDSDSDAASTSITKPDVDSDADAKPDVAKVAQAAAQQQAYYDAYMFNMMRFREAQAAAMMHRQKHKRSRHRHGKKGNKAHAKHRHKHRHHRMRFRQTFSPYPMMTPQSYYQQYYSHPRFRQMMPGMPGMPGMPMMGGMPGMGSWPDPAKEAFGDPEDDQDDEEDHHANKDKEGDDEEDEDEDEDEDNDATNKEDASNARFREVLNAGNQAMHKSAGHVPLAYGDPMNSPNAAAAPHVQSPNRIGGLGGAYSPPVPHANAAGATGTVIAHPLMAKPTPSNANAYAAMRFRSTNAPAAAPGKPNGDPNPTGVPMPMYAPTQPPPPAPNQVPAPASMIGHQIFPQNIQMANGRKYMPTNPPVTQQQISHMPQAMNPTTTTGQYPFSSFLQIDEKLEAVANAPEDDTETLAEHPQPPLDWYNMPRGTVPKDSDPLVHPRLMQLAQHPYRMYMRTPLLKEHTEEFPLL